MNPFSFGSSLGIGPQAMAERFRIIKFIFYSLVIIIVFSFVRSCQFELPSWLGGQTKEEVIQINKELNNKITEITDINNENVKDRERAQEADKAADKVHTDFKETVKVINKTTETRIDNYKKSVEAIGKYNEVNKINDNIESSPKSTDKTSMDTPEMKQLITVSVDAIWDAFEN